jgi:EAL domain-containing protein (putative c-di-GMP-specific phosphodiesterase class I)
MRQYGCKIAIDDFGSGFSSMENILKLKPEYIKIDGSLIKNLDISEGSRMIVEAIVNMSKGFHAKTIAEYVESEMIQDIVISLGVDYLQGYYLGKPKPYM